MVGLENRWDSFAPLPFPPGGVAMPGEASLNGRKREKGGWGLQQAEGNREGCLSREHRSGPLEDRESHRAAEGVQEEGGA